ncbi:MAG: dTDP-4-amino-4,6-dideoxygalactose transaminase [Gammaproteobacteria bacterium]|nr:dTDP-4-amino-4,6-dideoxygalactose transaminase [Gammaproteobacteria bacterium]
MSKIPYSLSYFGEKEIAAVNDLLANPSHLTSETYTKLCRDFLKNYYQREMLVTHSCTAALEMSALLLNIQPGDEVILPSFTFVSTANAFALFGARLVFVDIQKDTLNMDPLALEAAITPKTKAIVVMHYAAVACDMAAICAIADAKGIPIVEDAAQCIGAQFNGKYLGTFGKLGTLSFHHTKNITAGLGGALIINDEALIDRAKVICQKGTNRDAFIEGLVDKYTWQDLGSSYVMNEFGAAVLLGQLERMDVINKNRQTIWQQFHEGLVDIEKWGYSRPSVPKGSLHNAHIYYLIAPTEQEGTQLRQFLASQGITAPHHYIPLHLSPAGKKFGKPVESLPVCESIYKRIVRLPLWEGFTGIEAVIGAIYKAQSTSASLVV